MDFNYINNLDDNIERQLTESIDGAGGSWTFCPECGTRNSAESAFCCECGTQLSPQEPIGNSEYNGIIMTDISRLARKYSCRPETISSCLERFVEASKEYCKVWALFDAGKTAGANGSAEWSDYSDALDTFMRDNTIGKSPSLSLFIIGGHDVIPQPTSDNPSGGDSEYDKTIFSDFYYCFSKSLPLDFLDFRKARCNVGRLPLESGQMDTSFENDIMTYLDRTVKCIADGGISVGRAIMTSNSDWIPASREMSRNLPTPHFDNVENETLDNMFLSPGVLEEMPESLANKYYSALGEADMLVFNLHGSCEPESSGFYSEGLAFSIDTLSHTSAKIFNTVACWGGRYIRYRRAESMLLNAIYNSGVLLYAGACVPALGKCGKFQRDQTWRIQPAAYSETFMARYSEYQCIGKLNAGEAFLKAKCDYYNSSRMVEDDEHILSTVLMFNLYGNPALSTVPDLEAISAIQEPTGAKETRIPFRPMKKEVVMNKSAAASSMSVYGSIRAAVDSSLRHIHDVVTEQLYNKLGIEPRQLSIVEKYTSADAHGFPVQGYLFNYNIDKGMFRSRIIAKTDNLGIIKSVIETK